MPGVSCRHGPGPGGVWGKRNKLWYRWAVRTVLGIPSRSCQPQNTEQSNLIGARNLSLVGRDQGCVCVCVHTLWQRRLPKQSRSQGSRFVTATESRDPRRRRHLRWEWHLWPRLALAIGERAGVKIAQDRQELQAGEDFGRAPALPPTLSPLEEPQPRHIA